jgi:hypothetical protein
MEQYPGAGMTISRLLYALERELDDVTNKRRLDDRHIAISLKLTSKIQITSTEIEAGRCELPWTGRDDWGLKHGHRFGKCSRTSPTSFRSSKRFETS